MDVIVVVFSTVSLLMCPLCERDYNYFRIFDGQSHIVRNLTGKVNMSSYFVLFPAMIVGTYLHLTPDKRKSDNISNY